MCTFFDPWMRAWYPDNWVTEPGFIWPLFYSGLVCFFGFIYVVRQLNDAKSRRIWKLWLGLGFLGIFIWALPILLDIIVELVMYAIAAAVFILVLVLILAWGFSESSDENGDNYSTQNGKKYDSKTGKRIIKQDGRTYRQNSLGKWVADKDLIGTDKVEKDWMGSPKIEKDLKGDQKIEKDWKSDPIVPPKDKSKN